VLHLGAVRVEVKAASGEAPNYSGAPYCSVYCLITDNAAAPQETDCGAVGGRKGAKVLEIKRDV
jgi:hypothetical protein